MEKYYFVGDASDDGYAIKVRSTDRLYNYVNREGNLISKEWFTQCGCFINRIAPVCRYNNQWNYIKENGEYLFDKWYTYCSEFDKEGFGVITERLIINGEYISNQYAVNTKGEILNKTPFLYIRGFQNGFAVVTGFNRKYNIINTKGEIVLPNWYQNIYTYDNGLASVEYDNKVNFIDLKQENVPFVSNQWYDRCGCSFNFNRMCVGIKVKDDYMYNYINEYGEIISPIWFENCDKHFVKHDYQKSPLVEVKLLHKGVIKYNFMDINGNIVYKAWLESRIF